MTHPNEKAKKYDLVDIDYNKYLEPYLSFQNNCAVTKGGDADKTTKLYQGHLILTKEFKQMQKYRAINAVQVFYGVGRQKDQG